jgi:hypothetical protein
VANPNHPRLNLPFLGYYASSVFKSIDFLTKKGNQNAGLWDIYSQKCKM